MLNFCPKMLNYIFIIHLYSGSGKNTNLSMDAIIGQESLKKPFNKQKINSENKKQRMNPKGRDNLTQGEEK